MTINKYRLDVITPIKLNDKELYVTKVNTML